MVSYCPVVGAGKPKVTNNVHRVVRRWPQTPLSFLGRRYRGAGTSHVRRLADTASDEEGAQAEIAQLSERIKTLSEELNKERTSFRTFVMLWGSLQGYKADASRKRRKNPLRDDIVVHRYAEAAASKLTQANLWAGCLDRLADKIADLQSDLDRRTSGRGAAHQNRHRRGVKAKTHARSSGDERRPSRGDTDAGPSTPSTSSAAGTGMLSPTPLDVVKEQLMTAVRVSRRLTNNLWHTRRKLARLRQGTGTEDKVTRATEAYNGTVARHHRQLELVMTLRKKLRDLMKDEQGAPTSTKPSTDADERGWYGALVRLQRYDITPRPEDGIIPWHTRPSFRDLSQHYSPFPPVSLKDVADPPDPRASVAQHPSLPSPGSAVGNSPLADNPASGDAPTAFGPPPTPYSSDLPLWSYGAHLAAEGPAGSPDPWAASSASSSPHLQSTASRSLMSTVTHVKLRRTAGTDARATPSPSVTLEDPTMKATAQHPLTARQAQAQASAASGCTSVEVVAHKAGKKSAKKKSLEAEVRDRGEVGAIDGSRLLHDAQPLGHLGPGAGASQAPQASLFGQAARSYAGVPHGGGDSPTGHAFQSDLQFWLQGRRIPFKQRESVGSGARADRDESGQAGSSGPSRSPSTRGNMSPHYPEATRKTQR
ncbi:hypothetical protein BESB_030690 [Besnoitia besnoiti]|uniref:Uncharacterized protein n=1 Tax=Besnoitia besnoiti TaxID=94643 RepID=A0A2A9LZK9_BESBE|nr:hypothetical protein BESB_030690 [Besnoitia besnoiti]PFH31195.1 hypothetical protein BESB_030690 [Besnoitia besnoiti]